MPILSTNVKLLKSRCLSTRHWKHKTRKSFEGSFNSDTLGKTSNVCLHNLSSKYNIFSYAFYFTLVKFLLYYPVLSWAHNPCKKLEFQPYTILPGFCLFLIHPICSRPVVYPWMYIIKQSVLYSRPGKQDALETNYSADCNVLPIPSSGPSQV